MTICFTAVECGPPQAIVGQFKLYNQIRASEHTDMYTVPCNTLLQSYIYKRKLIGVILAA